MDCRKEFLAEPDTKVKLKKIDPSYTGNYKSEDEVKGDIDRYLKTLFRQHGLLFAESKHAILIVLQALDAGGKDGTIKHVFTSLNPQGVSVIPFEAPTPIELAHDFLWRVHPHAPAKGHITIFNRSHYEDVLVPRAHKLIDKQTWKEREKQIRNFESLLAEHGGYDGGPEARLSPAVRGPGGHPAQISRCARAAEFWQEQALSAASEAGFP